MALRQRTCISCKGVKDKHAMFRFFKSKTGDVRLDPKGNMPGRGAYVCSPECLEIATEKNLIGRSLRVKFANGFDDVEKREIETFFANMNDVDCKE